MNNRLKKRVIGTILMLMVMIAGGVFSAEEVNAADSGGLKATTDKGKLTVRKVDVSTGDPISGVKFRLYPWPKGSSVRIDDTNNNENSVNQTNKLISDTAPYIVTTNSDGNAEFTGLPKVNSTYGWDYYM